MSKGDKGSRFILHKHNAAWKFKHSNITKKEDDTNIFYSFGSCTRVREKQCTRKRRTMAARVKRCLGLNGGSSLWKREKYITNYITKCTSFPGSTAREILNSNWEGFD